MDISGMRSACRIHGITILVQATQSCVLRRQLRMHDVLDVCIYCGLQTWKVQG